MSNSFSDVMSFGEMAPTEDANEANAQEVVRRRMECAFIGVSFALSDAGAGDCIHETAVMSASTSWSSDECQRRKRRGISPGWGLVKNFTKCLIHSLRAAFLPVRFAGDRWYFRRVSRSFRLHDAAKLDQ